MVGVFVGVRVGVDVLVAVGVAVSVGVAVGVCGSHVGDGVLVAVGVTGVPTVGAKVGVGVRDGVHVGVGVLVAVGVNVLVAVDVGMLDGVSDGVGVSVSLACARTARGREEPLTANAAIARIPVATINLPRRRRGSRLFIDAFTRGKNIGKCDTHSRINTDA
jgi:hypothetical protein